MKYLLLLLLCLSSGLQASVSLEDFDLLSEDFLSFIVPLGQEYEPEFTRSIQLDRNNHEFGAFETEPITVHMGLLTSRAMTVDSVLLILCHEVGHNTLLAKHFIGNRVYAFGHLEPDYFASSACILPLMASSQHFVDKRLSESELNEIPKSYRDRCSADFVTNKGADHCLRSVHAAIRMVAGIYDSLREQGDVSASFPPPSLERKHLGPKDKLQARLITLVAGIFGDPPLRNGVFF